MPTLTLLLSIFLLGAKHIGPSYDTKPRYALDAFATKYAKKHKMDFLVSGCGPIADSKKGVWVISLLSREKMMLEEARELAGDLAYELLYKIFHDPLYAEYCKLSHNKNVISHLKEEHVGFRIAFWDENMDRPLYPYVAQVRLADNKLYFHYADPETQALQEPVVLNLDELNLPRYRE